MGKTIYIIGLMIGIGVFFLPLNIAEAEVGSSANYILYSGDIKNIASESSSTDYDLQSNSPQIETSSSSANYQLTTEI